MFKNYRKTALRNLFHSSGVPLVLPDAFRQDFLEAEQVTFTSYRSDALIPNNSLANCYWRKRIVQV